MPNNCQVFGLLNERIHKLHTCFDKSAKNSDHSLSLSFFLCNVRIQRAHEWPKENTRMLKYTITFRAYTFILFDLNLRRHIVACSFLLSLFFQIWWTVYYKFLSVVFVSGSRLIGNVYKRRQTKLRSGVCLNIPHSSAITLAHFLSPVLYFICSDSRYFLEFFFQYSILFRILWNNKINEPKM